MLDYLRSKTFKTALLVISIISYVILLNKYWAIFIVDAPNPGIIHYLLSFTFVISILMLAVFAEFKKWIFIAIEIYFIVAISAYCIAINEPNFLLSVTYVTCIAPLTPIIFLMQELNMSVNLLVVMLVSNASIVLCMLFGLLFLKKHNK